MLFSQCFYVCGTQYKKSKLIKQKIVCKFWSLTLDQVIDEQENIIF